MTSGSPDYDLFLKRIEKCLDSPVTWEGAVYRSVIPEYASSEDLWSGLGSAQSGGRWNPVGMAAVYTSETPEVAMAETLAHFRYYGIPIERAMPRLFVALDVSFSKLLDLTSAKVRSRVGALEETLINCDWRKEMELGLWPITQDIGKAAFESGFEGLLAPSSTVANGRNLVWFPKKSTRTQRGRALI